VLCFADRGRSWVKSRRPDSFCLGRECYPAPFNQFWRPLGALRWLVFSGYTIRRPGSAYGSRTQFSAFVTHCAISVQLCRNQRVSRFRSNRRGADSRGITQFPCPKLSEKPSRARARDRRDSCDRGDRRIYLNLGLIGLSPLTGLIWRLSGEYERVFFEISNGADFDWVSSRQSFCPTGRKQPLERFIPLGLFST